jgi:hypothetical protein
MSRRRKAALIAGVVIALGVLCVSWLRPIDPTHEGRTMEEWFEQYRLVVEARSVWSADETQLLPVLAAFESFGTNAVPFLASRITRDQNHSTVSEWRIKLWGAVPKSGQKLVGYPRNKAMDGHYAADLLRRGVKPPGELLIPLLDPAWHNTNVYQRVQVLQAMMGITTGKESAKPYIAEGLKDPHYGVRTWAASAATLLSPNDVSVVGDLLELTKETDNRPAIAALETLGRFGTNVSHALPMLNEMQAKESHEIRRDRIAELISQIKAAETK